MKITSLKAGKRGSILVYADGEYILSVPREVFLKTNIKMGYEITDEEIENISSDIEFYKAKSRAYNILSYRAHSKKELGEKIKRKTGISNPEKVVSKMEEIGLIDDKKYALEYASHLFKNKLYGIKRIAFELSKKGISKENINFAIENLDMNEYENIQKIVSKKNIQDEKEKKKTIANLIRRGYSWEKINSVLNNDF